MTELSKYRTVYTLGEANDLVVLGYKLHTYMAPIVDGVGCSTYVMSLSSEKAYDNISNLKDVAPDDVYEYLSNGWIVADAYSKFVRMVKKNV